MPDKILESVLSGQLELESLLTWLRSDNLEEAGEDCLLQRCSRNEFTVYFLSYLRTETENIVENDSGARVVVCATPERSEDRVHRRTASDPTADTPAKPHHSPNREKKRSGRKVKTKLFTEDKSKELGSPDDSRVVAGMDRLALATSTPYKNESTCSSPRDTRSPVTPSGRPSRLDATLGDFLSVSTTSHRGKKKKRDSKNSDDLDASADKSNENQSGRKSSSLRSEKRRIKPTNIDLSKKSISLNNFGTEFQKVGALALENNEVFSAPPLLAGSSCSGSPGFAAERDALRRERHRLLEKFSSLSAATSPKCSTPLIKISQEESYIYPDISKVTCEAGLEVLARVYQVLLDSHLVLTYTSELCFLLALVRGRQKIDAAPSPSYLLRSVHNAASLAARALRSQRGVLTALLDRPELRALAEARVIRTMAPDLAKSLLDVYGLRGETAIAEPLSTPPTVPAGHVVAWNTETDGADNFPTTLSFHSFKKQRDMFYDIARWYDETGGGTGGAGPSLRTRVRSLIAAGAAHGQSNYAHLGVLIAKHALANTAGGGQSQESRLSKLSRRLTRPPQHQTNALFTPEEEFYRELVSCTENEPFRAAVRDALATELRALDCATVHTGASLVSLSRATMTLGRLLGLLAALPHCPLHQPMTSRRAPPPRMLALRAAEMPMIDITSCVLSALHSGRLCVTLPWTSAYLSTLAAYDALAPRLLPYTTLLRLLRAIYRQVLPKCPPLTALYLRCTLSSLFAQQNIPQELLYDDEPDEELNWLPSGLDATAAITCVEIASLLSARKELATLLAGGSGGARHVTPLRVGPEPHRAKHAYTHIQKRLEEAVVRSCGGGARRVLELVCERVSTAALTNLTRALSVHRHKPNTACDVTNISTQGTEIKAQLQAALNALLSERGCRGAECALAERAVRARLARHTRDTAELCDAAAAAVRTLVGGAWGPTTPLIQATPTSDDAQDIATALIELRECVCLCLEQKPPNTEALCEALTLASRVGPNAPRGTKRTALQLSLDLCVAAACCEGGTLSEPLLASAERVWAACAPRNKDGGQTPPVEDTNAHDRVPDPELDDLSEIFSRVISPRVVRQVAYRTRRQWDALKQLVVFMTSRGWLCANQLTESCVALYSRDYDQDVVSGLGAWLRELAEALGAGGDAHPALFLGFLGEYCHDL